MTVKTPSILALTTTAAPYRYHQSDLAAYLTTQMNLTPPEGAKLKHIFKQTDISHRHSILPDFDPLEQEKELYHSHSFTRRPPTTKERNAIYKVKAPHLAHQAAHQALKQWGGDKQKISHIIVVSCTGLYAPGIEAGLITSLGLSPKTSRLALNFMGCFGALKGLQVAHAITCAASHAHVLLVCIELCTLHLTTSTSLESIVGAALFADGAAAAIIANSPEAEENALWRIKDFASLLIKDSHHEMTWQIGDHGFEMNLTSTIPKQIARQIASVGTGIGGATAKLWAIHPGGKAILKAVQESLDLKEGHMEASRRILKDYGNMSSATFLFVLKQLELSPQHGMTLGLAFGPGLAVEGIVLEKKRGNGTV